MNAPVITRARRMDISELPTSAQHHRNGLWPSAYPLVDAAGKIQWVPSVINGRACAHTILWSGTACDDRDEAFDMACLSCDRFVVAEYLDAQGQISIATINP